MEFQEIVQQRKSVRSFRPDPIAEEDILSIIQAGLSAPSPCNQQLWRFVIVNDAAVKERLISEAYSSTIIRRAASVIVVMYDGWNYKEAIQSGSMAIMNMLNRSWDMQIGSCCINSFGNEVKIKEILKIPETYVITAFVILGHSDELKNQEILNVDRRPAKEVVSFNAYQSQWDYSKSYDPEAWKREHLEEYQRYFCRKTILGKQMDLISDYELKVVQDELAGLKGNVLDIFSYDGSYLKFFPKRKMYSLNLSEMTGRYALSALNLDPSERALIKGITWDSLSEETIDLTDIQQITLVMKAERVSQKILSDLLTLLNKKVRPGAELTIISRKKNFFLNMFLSLLRKFFGDDVRKTGIFAFWGPYQPLDVNGISGVLIKHGWKPFETKQYFFMPAFFQQILQMVFQYYKSGKTSYIHRTVHRNLITGMYDGLLKVQGFRKTRHGSLVVLKFRL